VVGDSGAQPTPQTYIVKLFLDGLLDISAVLLPFFVPERHQCFHLDGGLS
jgi:hypothetical protein